MIVDGREIAQKIFSELKKRVEKLKEKDITPHLHIITITTDSASQAYVSQKKLKGGEIGAKITVENLSPNIKTEDLLERIRKLNNDNCVHGIIIQRPVPKHIDENTIANSIDPNKDVDGFHPNSKFTPPIALAVLKILEKVYASTPGVDVQKPQRFSNWLGSKKIAVIGRGVTAGKPIIKTLEKMRITLNVETSKTENQEILKSSDIVICAVGKPNIIKKDDLKNSLPAGRQGVILIGVGMFKGKDGKFYSDYNEEDIKDVASFYTPTPGGVGPVNVAMLLSNLIKGTENLHYQNNL